MVGGKNKQAGPFEVSLSGYFEPKADDMSDEMYGYNGGDPKTLEEGLDDDSDDTAGDKMQKNFLKERLKQAETNKGKNAYHGMPSDSEE